MKRIVDGVTYNTDTATRVGATEWNDDDNNPVVSTLYQTRGGAFFLDHQTTKTVWVERAGSTQERVEHSFEPIGPDGAQKWMLEGEVEVFNNVFEDPPEAAAEVEPGATIYIRVPASLKRRVDEAAAANKLSGNAWSMRCLENCLAAGSGKDEPEYDDYQNLVIAWHIATMTREGMGVQDATGALETIAELIGAHFADAYGIDDLADGATTANMRGDVDQYRDRFMPKD